MNVKLVTKKASDIKADLLVIPAVADSEKSGQIRQLAPAVRKRVEARMARMEFTGQPGSTLNVQTDSGDVLVVGVGDGKSAEVWRRAAASAWSSAAALKAGRVALGAGTARPQDRIEPLLEGFRLAAYRFDKYLSKKKKAYTGPRVLQMFADKLPSSAATKSTVDRVNAVCDSVCEARDLINEMPSVKTPNYLVAAARRIARKGGLRCEVWQGARLKREKMNGILAVSAGSRQPGALIHLVYKPKRRTRATVAVVGKGITFDSGGLSLKPAGSMEAMKMDMSGAAAVLGLMRALPALEPAVEVHGYIAAAENMPGGSAQKPGDIITFRNGTSAEVLNTDAEGRLVLADALALAAEREPDAIIDLATLTGACMVALGTRVAGVMGNDQELIDGLIQAGNVSGESLWQLPLVEDYNRDIRSTVADIKNIGGGYGGTITAALFLQRFVADVPWAHLDIAGPAYSSAPAPYRPKGGTGFGIRALLAYLDALV